MNRRLKNFIVTLVCLLAFSSVAHAQLKDNIEVNLFGGGSIYNRNKFEIGFPQSAIPIQETFKLSRAVRGGLRVGVFDRGHWSQEFFYSYEPNIAHFVRVSAPSTSVDLRLRIHNYGITGLYYFQDNELQSIRPFVSIGVGGTLYRLTQEAESIARDPLRGNLPGIKNSHLLALNYGVGVKVRPSSSWIGFRVDVRGFLGPNPSFRLPRQSDDPNAIVFPAGGAIHNGEASAGVIFYFFDRR